MTVHEHGPLFDGEAAALFHRGAEAARARLADEGRRRVIAAFMTRIKVNTGRFLSSVTTTDATRTYASVSGHHAYTMTVAADPVTDTVVTSSIVTYGAWLEGVGSRNETTRFKGYHGFRQAAQELDAQAGEIADQALRPYVEEINA